MFTRTAHSDISINLSRPHPQPSPPIPCISCMGLQNNNPAHSSRLNHLLRIKQIYIIAFCFLYFFFLMELLYAWRSFIGSWMLYCIYGALGNDILKRKIKKGMTKTPERAFRFQFSVCMCVCICSSVLYIYSIHALCHCICSIVLYFYIVLIFPSISVSGYVSACICIYLCISILYSCMSTGVCVCGCVYIVWFYPTVYTMDCVLILQILFIFSKAHSCPYSQQD